MIMDNEQLSGISACLLGIPCRYDGGSKGDPEWMLRSARGKLLPLCPETLGGLTIPRPPSEIIGGDGEDVLDGRARVKSADGEDVTQAYLEGARRALALCRERGVTTVYLKSRSPSCGCGQIHDGSFAGGMRSGDGVTAALFKREGIRVVCIG